MLEPVLKKLIVAEPDMPESWYDLAQMDVTQKKDDEAIKFLLKAISLSDERLKTNPKALNLRNSARTDSAFDPIRKRSDFPKLIEP